MSMNNENWNNNRDDEQKIDRSESTLFAAPAPETKTFTARRRESSLKKQRKTAIILAIVVVVAILAYFFVVKPIVNYVEEVIKPEIELLEGEVLGTSDRILLFDQLERDEIKEIKVHNEYGEFGFYYDEDAETFYVTGYPSAPYDKEKIASLIVSTGYTLSIKRVTTECENWEEYGLADSDNPAWYTIIGRKGENHTVYIGDAIPTGAGYYVRYKDRNAVYILDSTLGDTVLQPLENMITPALVLPMNANDYFTLENFTIMKDDEVSVMITFLDEEEKVEAGSLSAYRMLAPANYTVNESNYSQALQALASLTGTSTLIYDPTEEELKQYGLDKPEYVLYYTYQGIEQYIMFSKSESGNYYAYTLLFDLITELPTEMMQWLDWDLIQWVDISVFMMDINDVKSIKVDSETATRIFDLEGEGQELTVTERETGFKPEVQNFRQFYKTLLTIYMQGYVELTEEEIKALDDEKDLYMTLTIETRAGKTKVYKFYPYSTRRAYYTVDGKGEFYVLRDMVTKVITDAEKIMTNTPVDSEAHS